MGIASRFKRKPKGGLRGIERFKDKLKMYDMMIANLWAGDSIMEPEENLDNSKISIGFGSVASSSQVSKYFMITALPDYMDTQFIDKIRSRCVRPGTKINTYMYSEPYNIDWDSSEMKHRLRIWKEYTAKNSGDANVFEYRAKRGDALARERVIKSTKYLNESELDQRRTLFRTSILVEISCKRDPESLANIVGTIRGFKRYCNDAEIKYKGIRVNLLDWLKYFGPFSLNKVREVASRVPRVILTDDILANLNGYSQGRIGLQGVPLGIDVHSKFPVIKRFKEGSDNAENWLVAAETGGGKSYFIKVLLLYLFESDFIVTVMDYEGEEYLNIANYIKEGNPDDVKVISMGKGHTVYFDPMEIGDLTGDIEIDNGLKDMAITYVMAIFRVMLAGVDDPLDQWEESVVSEALRRVYGRAGVTEDKHTWKLSKGLRLKMVYEEIKVIADKREFVDPDTDNIKHKAAVSIAERLATYFEVGAAKYGTFKNPMSVNELYGARFVVFSFGMAGAVASQIDPVILALKQLSVASVSIQISNHCKYVLKKFNVKVWEEYQRWGDIKGSAEIITNAFTGGRKRGDVNLLVTNNLRSILDDNNPVSAGIRQNITSMAIGKIKDKGVRRDFCELFSERDLERELANIARANTGDNDGKGIKGKNRRSLSKYSYAFCLILDNGSRAVAKVMLPRALRESSLFSTGVDRSGKEGEGA